MSQIYYATYSSTIGPLVLLRYQGKLIYVKYGTMETVKERLTKWSEKHQLPTTFQESTAELEPVITQLDEYFQQKRTTFSIDYRFYGTTFQKKVWQALASRVAYGATCSYQDIADYIAAPKAVRAVGGANNKNPISIIVPCHRVIGKNGKLVGYGGGLDKKEYLLALEQADTENR
ncbi:MULTISPECIES: methylated-DNA--[protein]-cysteine S-methyltransferase [Gracilibacillus]|uniref:methylated-DNA--[protein]-cysteine S-methyltransferase n=1 Tax=Gracilibacillus TaxID=74385 RepID=UPI00098FDE5B|nr:MULTISPECIES: methylated-DNA--[protein]-cysteine S-methyltransferase [Gracilibacillus]